MRPYSPLPSTPFAQRAVAKVALLAVLLVLYQSAIASSPPAASALSYQDRIELESLLHQEVLGIVTRQEATRSSRRSAPALNKVLVDTDSNHVIVDLSVRYLPPGIANYSGALQDRLHEITTGVISLLESDLKLSISGVTYTFDGKDLSYYYPSDFPRS